MDIKLAKTAGFCFGVKRAVNTVYEQIENGDKPIYTLLNTSSPKSIWVWGHATLEVRLPLPLPSSQDLAGTWTQRTYSSVLLLGHQISIQSQDTCSLYWSLKSHPKNHDFKWSNENNRPLLHLPNTTKDYKHYGQEAGTGLQNTYSIIDASLVSKMWSVRIQGMDISIGNWILLPIVNSRKNSRNHNCERSQHCWSVS